MLKSFLKEISEIANRGDAREGSYYSSLEVLLTEYLDQIETSEQLKRYRNTFPNLILTNFLEFRLYRNGILKEQFNKRDGFADTKITVLDPAAGTLTFLASAAKLAIEEFVSKHGEGMRERFIKEHILENFYAFELMMAPYAVGHLKMSFLLEEAGKVKKETPILVILGNPPYSGISANMKPWIVNLLKEDVNGLQSYYKIDGHSLKEKKLWLMENLTKCYKKTPSPEQIFHLLKTIRFLIRWLNTARNLLIYIY